MNQGTLGEQLRTLRKKRNLTQAKLAERAQVSTRSIVYWESDRYTPGEYEMQALLNALGVPLPEQAGLLLSLSTLRNENLVRSGEALKTAAPAMLLPGAGDLLSALRSRQNWTRAETASRLGVTVSTLGRWETNRFDIPEAALPQIEKFLKAAPAEIHALRQRMVISSEETSSHMEQARHGEQMFRTQRNSPGVQTVDLTALAVQRKLWLLAVSSPEALLPLAHTTHRYANWLYAQNRPAEGQHQARNVLHLYTHDSRRITEQAVPHALNLLCWHAAYGGQGLREQVNRPEEGLRLLNRWLPRLTQARTRIPVLADAALLAAGMGQFDVASRYLVDAQRSFAATGSSDPSHSWYLQVTRAKILLEAGRPQEALNALPAPMPNPSDPYATVAPFGFLLYIRTLLALGERDQAGKWLTNVYTSLAHVEVPRLRANADSLARQI